MVNGVFVKYLFLISYIFILNTIYIIISKKTIGFHL